jgi:hypothetical protein
LLITHPDGNSPAAVALGARGTSIVRPVNKETGDTGLIKKPENIRDLGEARIADLVAAGQMEELDLWDGPERRVAERRQTAHRRNQGGVNGYQ